MNTTTIHAEQLEVGTRFGYEAEFVVTAIGPTDDGIFNVNFDRDGVPESRFFSVDERIIILAGSK